MLIIWDYLFSTYQKPINGVKHQFGVLRPPDSLNPIIVEIILPFDFCIKIVFLHPDCKFECMPKCKKIILAITWFITAIHGMSYAQESIYLTDIFEKALDPDFNKRVVEVDGYTISFDNLKNSSSAYLHAYILNKFDSGSLTFDGERIVIPKHLRIKNCTFKDDFVLENFSFPGFVIMNTEISGIEFINCDFKSLKIESNELRYKIALKMVRTGQLSIGRNMVGVSILMDSIEVNGNVNIGDNVVNKIEVIHSTFNLPEKGYFNNYSFDKTNEYDLFIHNNTFNGDSTANIELRGIYRNLDIRNNVVNVNFLFVRSLISERFFLVNNKFNGFVSFEEFLFSETWNELYWDQLAGYKLRYSQNGELSDVVSDMDNTIKFKNLITTYKDIHTIFLKRGDLESANACYSEMKELQGKWLKYIYTTQGGFDNFFRWQLNRLLKIYTKHGTDPALAVVMSLYVIIAFALLYFIFPSKWDNESRNKLLVDYKNLMQKKHKNFLAPLVVISGTILLGIANAITLSLNSFVTLGFGSIPTSGVSRYMCIVEGFVGWFLLSIFTVALINQVLA